MNKFKANANMKISVENPATAHTIDRCPKFRPPPQKVQIMNENKIAPNLIDNTQGRKSVRVIKDQLPYFLNLKTPFFHGQFTFFVLL